MIHSIDGVNPVKFVKYFLLLICRNPVAKILHRTHRGLAFFFQVYDNTVRSRAMVNRILKQVANYLGNSRPVTINAYCSIFSEVYFIGWYCIPGFGYHFRHQVV